MGALVKSFSVGNGDMFSIVDREQGGNLTVIDCCLNADRTDEIIKELKNQGDSFRFISTHPDKDHIKGLVVIANLIHAFWSSPNDISEKSPSDDMKAYCKLRDPKFPISSGTYISHNQKAIGINFLWPKIDSKTYLNALKLAQNDSTKYNGISPIFTYTYSGGAKFMWMGDLSSSFLAALDSGNEILWPEIDVLFAPHHGRDRVPDQILRKLKPRFIVIGEAAKEDLEYYKKVCEICQNGAGDIIFECQKNVLHIYLSKTPSKKLQDATKRDPSRVQCGWYVGSVDLLTTKPDWDAGR